jgi:hypothetical protein
MYIKCSMYFVSPAFDFIFPFSFTFSMSRTEHLLLPVQPFSYCLFFFFIIDPRNELNSVLQALFKKNISQFVHESRGPQHNITWTAIVYSQFLS